MERTKGLHLRRGLVLALVGLLTTTLGLSWAAPPAMACACGGVLTDTQAHVSDETSLVWFDGHRETITIQMHLTGPASTAAWIMPAPAGATLSLGQADALEAAAAASRPVVDRVTHYHATTLLGMVLEHVGMGSQAVPASGGVHVERVTRVGPFEVTTLDAARGTDVDRWLTSHGFGARPDLAPSFQHYLDQHWHIQAVRLTPEAAGTQLADLPPLQVEFPTQQLVCPERLSGHATLDQHLTVYVAAPHRMEITTQPARGSSMQVQFAGMVSSTDLGHPGTNLVAGASTPSAFLTTYEQTMHPGNITDDVVFAQAPTDDSFQRHVQDVHTVDVPVDVVVFLAFLVVLAVLALTGDRVLRRHTERARTGSTDRRR